MATVQELWAGVRGDQKTRSIGYLVAEATDDNDALNAAEAETPLIYDGMPRDNITVSETSQKDGLYLVTAQYRRGSGQKQESTGRAPNTTGTDNNNGLFSFDGAIEPQRMLIPVADYAPGEAQIGFPNDGFDLNKHELVNADPNGQQGYDTYIARSHFGLDYYPANNLVTTNYQKHCLDLIGTVNTTTFMTYEPGEVMLISVNGEARNDEDWRLSFRFETRPNRQDAIIAGIELTGFLLRGFDGYWIEQIEATDTNQDTGTQTRVQLPRQVNVFKQYFEADLNELFQPQNYP